MSQNELTNKLEEVQAEAEKAHSLLTALSEAITYGSVDHAEYEWAFSALGDLTFSIKRELKDMVDELFEVMRTDKQCKCPYRQERCTTSIS